MGLYRECWHSPWNHNDCAGISKCFVWIPADALHLLHHWICNYHYSCALFYLWSSPPLKHINLPRLGYLVLCFNFRTVIRDAAWALWSGSYWISRSLVRRCYRDHILRCFSTWTQWALSGDDCHDHPDCYNLYCVLSHQVVKNDGALYRHLWFFFHYQSRISLI